MSENLLDCHLRKLLPSINRRRFLAGAFLGATVGAASLNSRSFARAAAPPMEPPAGVRIFYTGHSFHMFVPPPMRKFAP